MDQPGDLPPVAGLRVAALLVALEGVVLALAGAGYAASVLFADAEDPLATALGGAMALATGLGLLAAARGLDGARRRARTPAVVWQLVSLAVGYNVVAAGLWQVGVPVLVVAAGVLLALATPDARLAYRE